MYESTETIFPQVSPVESILNNLKQVNLDFLNDNPIEYYREYNKALKFEAMYNMR